MKANKTKNGSLYFNEDLGQVVRVLGKINTNRVWTTQHEEGVQPVRSRSLRKATLKEISEYLCSSD